MPRRSAKKPPEEVRRRPSQERSRGTVDAIVQAAAYILVKRGRDALTTNAIADRAGVNIASLYQFFPNKEAVVAELERRHIEQTHARMAEVYLRHHGTTLEARIRTLVEAAIAEHAVAPELHRAFAERLPQQRHAGADPWIVESVTQLFTSALPRPELSAWLFATVAHAAVHEAIVERRADVESGALLDELVRLLVRYVR